MARKGNPKKRAVSLGTVLPDAKIQGTASNLRNVSSEVHSNVNEPTTPVKNRMQGHASDQNNLKQTNENCKINDSSVRETVQPSLGSAETECNHINGVSNMPAYEASGLRVENGTPPITMNFLERERDKFRHFLNGLSLESVIERFELSRVEFSRCFRSSVLPLLKQAIEWMRRLKPLLDHVKSKALNSRRYVQMKFKYMYPVILRLFLYVGNFVLLVSMLWLGCMLTGMNSFLRMGTSAFITVLWCGIFSAFAMIGMIKFLIILVIL